jgi:cytochrome c5
MDHPVSSNRRTSPAAAAGATMAAALALAAIPAGAAEQRTGADVVKAQCSHCHEAGTAGAPKIGDKAAWAQRFNRGVDALVYSAIRGHGGMPPRGGKADLTDAELRSALLYMFNPAGPPKDLPKSTQAPISPGIVHHKTVGGLDVYLGQMTAESLRAFPAGSPEARMHGGVPSGSGYYHMNVSLFDVATQKQITGATVDLVMEQLGMGSEKKSLEAHTMAGSTSYGGYVRLVPRRDYTFVVRVTRPGSATPVEAQFQEHLN